MTSGAAPEPEPPAATAARASSRAWPYVAVAAVATLPFLRGPFAGHPLYFRDLSLAYFPFRRFVLEGLREGVMRSWNPYVHEGVPLVAPAITYPFDLLQLLRPDEAGISFVLAMHIPLAAVWMMALARHGLRLSALAAAAGAIVYALGGFALSTVNLYVYAQALAWAPAAVLGLLHAGRGGARAVAVGALAVAVLMSTTAAEIVALAIAVGLVLALPCPAAALGRIAAALALAGGLVAPAAIVVASAVSDSARAGGLSPEVVLSHSIHPLTLAQVAVAGFHGDTARLTERWWGQNFFPGGFPYFLSLYLGIAALSLAAVGALQDRGPRRRLAGVAAVALLLALGRWGAGAELVESVEALRRFRYPSKVFFAAHLAVALLAALGTEALSRGIRASWRRLALIALPAGLLAASAPWWPLVAPQRARWFAAGFFPPDLAWPARLSLLDEVLRDAAAGGAVALAVGVLAAAAWSGRWGARPAALGIVGLLAADLLRSGAGLNPAIAASFYTPSPEIARHHAGWRGAGRLFTCHPVSSRAYAHGRAIRPDHEQWTFALLRDTAVPWFGVPHGLATALGPDLTMMVPPERLIDLADADCAPVDPLIARLRLAGVAHVIAIDPLTHPDLLPSSAESPAALAPVTVFAYALRDPLPLVSLAEAVIPARSGAEARELVDSPAFDPHAAVVVESTSTPSSSGGTADLRRHDPGLIEVATGTAAPAVLIVREGHAKGWKAFVDGHATTLLRANARHMAVVVPAGRHAIRLEYDPPGFRAGVWIFLASALAVLGLAAPTRIGRRAEPPAAA